ncbi:testis-expressed protein 9 isoform X2 [Sitophilus oryzae]|uniref:Testis-expressed protein 9 isoform X2 n=1 Tax=Sitophilus oryzae TaxID=7048 RepID=A0A6J2XGZ7_SITOR|nr:testis-expressed protein 9 isoform X2 [Sitophilus oryzae]
MESGLLMKEDEYYKENEKIEEQTKQLLQKVNDVMKIQDNMIRDSLKTQVELSNVKKAHYKVPAKSSKDHEDIFTNDFIFDEQKTSENSNNYSNGLCRVYRAKLKSIIPEKERLQSDLEHKNDEIRKCQKENQQFREEKEKWFLAYNGAKNTVGKLESQLTSLNTILQTKDSEMNSLKKDLEQLKKQLKSASLSLSNCEVRLVRTNEENDRLKIALKSAKEDEKELKESYRKQINELNSALKQIEKQKMELLNGFKKQMKLIDVLKKQKICLESVKVGKMLETEYLKLLEWKFE